MRYALTSLALALAACQPAGDADPGERPAGAPPPASADELRPMPEEPPATRASYVGTWSADPAWCANPRDEQRPVALTATEFRGYENACRIENPRPLADGWTATFRCLSEGESSTEQVAMRVEGDTLTLAWIDQARTVSWTRCPA